MSQVLITGASGFIGHRIGVEFQKKGYETIGWNRTETENVFPINRVDMADEDEVVRQLTSINPDIIIHCAGAADVGKSVKNPTMDFHGNVTITHNLLFSLHRAGIEKTRVVFLSSAGVYGNPISLPIKEDMPLNPLSPYAVHKVMCEDLCRYFVSNYGMNVKVARVFSAYGTGLRKQIFWDMHKKASDTGHLDMFGTGNESRDYIHVDDVVQSLYLIATEKSDHFVFNVANGEEVTIREATEWFADAAGIRRDNITFNGVVREGDPLNWRADISRIQELGYKKTVDMKTGLVEYVKWAENQG
jgi:Nucleoside-diphosphate-sugar epimerases